MSACFRRLVRLDGATEAEGAALLDGTFEPDLRRANARERRLLAKCARLDAESRGGLERAIKRTGVEVEYRGRLSADGLGRALRAALEDAADVPDLAAADDDDGDARGAAAAAARLAADAAAEADPETVDLVVRRLYKAHGRNATKLSHFAALVRSCARVFGAEPLRGRLERGLFVPLDKPAPLCWANMNAPGARLAANPLDPDLWRSADHRPSTSKKRKKGKRDAKGDGDAKEKRAVKGTAAPDTHLRVRNEEGAAEPAFGQDSFEALALRMQGDLS